MAIRKKRGDRNHIIYMLTCDTTQERYIGVTVMNGPSKWKALKARWSGHVYKARVLKEDWGLSQAIREYGVEDFWMEVVDVVRGRKDAFAYEASLINEIGTELNTKRKQ